MIVKVIVCLLGVTAALFGWRWWKSDASGEAVFTILSGIAIPGVLWLQNWWRKRQKGSQAHSDQSPEPSCELTVGPSTVRCFKEWVDYGLQVRLDIRIRGRLTIKSLRVEIPNVHKWESKNPFRRPENQVLVPQSDFDYLSEDQTAFVNRLLSMKGEDLRNVTLEEECRSITVLGYVKGERLPDAWEGIPLHGWRIVLAYNGDKEVSTTFTPQIHPRSCSRPAGVERTGFSSA